MYADNFPYYPIITEHCQHTLVSIIMKIWFIFKNVYLKKMKYYQQ